MAWIAKYATSEPVTVLDIGGRDVNGSPQQLFPAAAVYTVLDIRPGDDVDIVANAATWDPDGQQWDLIIAAETFEHTASPRRPAHHHHGGAGTPAAFRGGRGVPAAARRALREHPPGRARAGPDRGGLGGCGGGRAAVPCGCPRRRSEA
jgi:hypothetical protein